MSPSICPRPQIQSVAFTCRDAERSAAFFCDSLGFTLLGQDCIQGGAEAALLGLGQGQLRRLRLGVGQERLDLLQVLDPGAGQRPGRAIPPESRSCDLWFQHLCLVTPDLETLHGHLQPLLANGSLTAVSEAPQRLPDWNTAAAGIRAFKFRDADGHNLELLQFPAGKGDGRWHQPCPGPLPRLLGIDHSAIAIADTARSRAFYAAVLGLEALPSGDNSGPEQDRLDGLRETRVTITPLRCPQGMGIETLDYQLPNRGRPMPADQALQDLAHWHIRLAVSDLDPVAAQVAAYGGQLLSAGVLDLGEALPPWQRGLRLADPDGHELIVLE
ncbi:VOC family protein [Synechococcus sp. CBW1006]|uniref:VOC family protein n=1 Tax=Synechococcus sp. CBW1006 TaxID=1353138 RepID=UPI0018CE131F|nr:VOC family protein [Synechococcus sp. CBW1006]QPN66679.1 VOC family protein [Synechococcus sp. CBW1006]